MKKYFVYDDLVEKGKLFTVNKRYKVIGPAMLLNSRLTFKGNYTFGWPSVKRTEKDYVPGLLIEIPDKQENDLKRSFFGKKYKIKITEVKYKDKLVKARIFVLDNEKYRCEVPLKELIDVLKNAYEQWDFDKNIIKRALWFTISEYYKEMMKCEK